MTRRYKTNPVRNWKGPKSIAKSRYESPANSHDTQDVKSWRNTTYQRLCEKCSKITLTGNKGRESWNGKPECREPRWKSLRDKLALIDKQEPLSPGAKHQVQDQDDATKGDMKNDWRVTSLLIHRCKGQITTKSTSTAIKAQRRTNQRKRKTQLWLLQGWCHQFNQPRRMKTNIGQRWKGSTGTRNLHNSDREESETEISELDTSQNITLI
jgi:hypothetical protein